jgi:undecaprenyl-diphosphatase
MLTDISQSVVLGIAQGLGEFLPISSTAHLILIPRFFNWPDPGLSFDVALHVGTLIAVLLYFWEDWITIFKLTINNFKQKNQKNDYALHPNQSTMYNKNLLWLLVIATIPGVLAGYFLENKAGTIFRQPLIIALTLSLAGLVLYLADKYAAHRKDLKKATVEDAMIIGISQAIAVIPGISRSGATITAGLFAGLDRVSAARFSFLLSTPIIFGAAILKMPGLIAEGINVPAIIGILASAVSGYLAIKYLLKFVEKASYAVFFWYRLVLAIIIVLVYFF